MPQKILLDTDIGDDCDDALALGLICRSPELELVGITTVFGNVLARARQARTVLKVAGEKYAAIPVAAGCGGTMGQRSTFTMWGTTHASGEARYLRGDIPNQDSTCLPESQLTPLQTSHGVNFLIDALMRGNGDIVPVCIGAMTNLAAAMVLDRRIIAKTPRVVVMAGEFRNPFPEWNIRCDPEAAALVFAAPWRVDVVPWHIGNVVKFTPAEVEQMGASASPLSQRLYLMIKAWQAAGDPKNPQLPSLFDPMAVATLTHPDLMTWKTGDVNVELNGDTTYGFTTFQPSPTGRHRIAWDADRSASIAHYLSRVSGR